MALKKFEGKKPRIFKKMHFKGEGLLNDDQCQQIAKTIIFICLHCSKSGCPVAIFSYFLSLFLFSPIFKLEPPIFQLVKPKFGTKFKMEYKLL